MRALTTEQMRAADANGVVRLGDVALMRAAGEALAQATQVVAPHARRVVAFAGPGNNGGDAFAALARIEGDVERVVHAMPARSASEARRDAEAQARAAGVQTRPFPGSSEEAEATIYGADLLLDAMLGTGGHAEPPSEMRAAIEVLAGANAHVLAVDIPTGVNATTGAVSQHTVRADTTVALGALKVGLLLDPARAVAGRVLVADIGLESEVEAIGGARYEVLDFAEFAALLPLRGDESDKRSAGAPLVVAGSPQFPGAAVLCARGAARAGAGYVTVAAPSGAEAALRAHLIEQVVVTFGNDASKAIETLSDLTNHCSSAVIGPGLSLSDATGDIVRGFVDKLTLPFVLDASAFFHFAKRLELLRRKRCVMTPHEREFARLSGEGTVDAGTRPARLRSFVERTGIVTLLKGSATLVDDGTIVHVNPTGTNALATAGTGDVLSGIIGTLLAQGLRPVDAARAGAYWHGLAGREAARERPVGVIAGDVAEALGAALLRRPGALPPRLRALF